MQRDLQPEIEKLIANYQEKAKRYSAIVSHFDASEIQAHEAQIRVGVMIQVIDDLKRLAGIE